MWFITYRHSIRPNEAGIKFVPTEVETVASRQHLEALGYTISKIALTSKAPVDVFLAGALPRPESRLSAR